MNYFKNMDFKSLDLLGVEVVGAQMGPPTTVPNCATALRKLMQQPRQPGCGCALCHRGARGKWLANNYMCVPNKTVVVSGLRRPLQGIEEIMSN